MSTVPYFKNVDSESVFNKRYAAEKAQPFCTLSEVPASKWGREQLLACRLIRKTRCDTLPLLESLETTIPGNLGPEIQQFIEGPDPAHMGWSEFGLVRHYGPSLGQVWAGLAMFQGPQERRQPAVADSHGGDGGCGGVFGGGIESESEAEFAGRRGKRIRRNTLQEPFTDSGHMQVGSSSPLAEGSQGASSIGYIDPESHMLASQPEDETLHFIRCATRHILYFAPNQAVSDTAAVIEVRDAKVRLTATTPVLGRLLVAVDDGGLCLREQAGHVFRTLRNRVIMFEAKGTLQCLENGQPILSDACLAQMTCQALTARLADPQKELTGGRYVQRELSHGFSDPPQCYISASRSTLCLLP
ncbi:hypothetical protein LEL_10896 [Akanthomyces lecanii RCEF 1005]|uniref:Uncharacterized protein n=1 Tax=Akanthomyces lecanii RCEF 1005 TaxID=1081108 RepID=A0A167QZK1_CORDF|nr:hypothetical protein LEL_10896 [Akanthomyces lecanii RCEF 1005]